LLNAVEPKIERRRFHDLRHSAASLLIAAGVELAEVSMLLAVFPQAVRLAVTRSPLARNERLY
ncbi:MAG TPA: hypothetical protein VEV86_16480, partial [Vicinamibacterales bacterium]|nr:hypothetical protein [Vicinamibacterales bacterium]